MALHGNRPSITPTATFGASGKPASTEVIPASSARARDTAAFEPREDPTPRAAADPPQPCSSPTTRPPDIAPPQSAKSTPAITAIASPGRMEGSAAFQPVAYHTPRAAGPPLQPHMNPTPGPAAAASQESATPDLASCEEGGCPSVLQLSKKPTPEAARLGREGSPFGLQPHGNASAEAASSVREGEPSVSRSCSAPSPEAVVEPAGIPTSASLGREVASAFLRPCGNPTPTIGSLRWEGGSAAPETRGSPGSRSAAEACGRGQPLSPSPRCTEAQEVHRMALPPESEPPAQTLPLRGATQNLSTGYVFRFSCLLARQ